MGMVAWLNVFHIVNALHVPVRSYSVELLAILHEGDIGLFILILTISMAIFVLEWFITY